MSAAPLPVATPSETLHLLRVLAHGRRLLGAATLAIFVGATLVALVAPALLGRIVNIVVEGEGASAVTEPALLLLAVAIGTAVLSAIGDVLAAQLGEGMLADLREQVLDRALQLPLQEVERAGRGDLVARVSGDSAVVAGAVRSTLPALARAGLTLVLTGVALAILDWRLALAGMIGVPLQLHTLRWYLRRSAPVYAAEREAAGRRSQQLMDAVGGAETVRALGLTDAQVAAVAARSDENLQRALEANRLATRFYGRLNLAEVLGLSAILCTGFWLVDHDQASVGTATAAALYFHGLFDTFNTLLGLFDSGQEAAAALARLAGVAGLPAEERSDAVSVGRDVELDVAGVGFGYDPGRPVLEEIDLAVGSGEHVALVGVSGAGKSTLARLAAGIHEPDRGTIRLGTVGLRELDDLRHHVALVTQEVHVFAGTLADDLRLAALAATDDEVLSALERAGAGAWLPTLPDGLGTQVGDGGLELTTMQAQQVALARLFLVDPAIVILDEATADAGSAGARIVERAADELLRGRSALVVAHRLSQAAAADRIVVLADGHVVEQGTPDELVDAGGVYAELWAAWSRDR